MPIKEAKRGLKSFAAEGKKNYHPYLNPVKNMAMKPDTVPGIPGLEDYYIDRTDDPEQVKKIIDADAARKRRTDIFAQAEALFSDEILILNDIVLDNVPTTGISITYTSDIFVSETIRTSAPSVSTGGREDVILELNLVFQPGKAQTIKLRRLMAEIINHPFIFVWSNKIRRNLSIPDDESTVFVLENGAIRSITGQPGTIALDLTLHYFNHRPFSHHFFYNTYLPGQGPEVNKQDPTSAIEPGNEEASYSESHKVKEAQAKGKELAKTLDDKRSKNVPAIFPWDSQPWLYYASTLEDTVPTISEDYCDYIGFKLNRFRYINPPPQAQTGGTLKDFLLKNPNVEEAVGIWKLSSGVSDFIAKGAAKGQADKQVKDESEAQAYYTQEKNMREGAQTSVPSGKRDPILLYSNAYKIEKRIQLVNENGSVRREAVDEIYDLVKPLARSAKNTETKIHPDVLILLQHVADNYPGKKIIIISGIRGAFTTEDLKVANASLRDNRHSHLKGHAIDILVEGISEEKLHEFTRTIPYCGSIQYTSSLAEVHIEISSRMEGFWEVKDKDNKTPLAAGRNSGTVKKQLIPPTGEQAKKDVVSAKTKQEQERQKILDRAKQKDVPIKETSGSAPKEKQSRIDWIRNIENLEGITYYLGSKNVRNVFYETLQLNTSGDKEDQDTGLALPNLACTAIAVSFGHKLAPLGLASQKRYSYQFVGAGNKAGQLVFTFAGPEGRASADALKNLFSLAKDNALYFGQMIDDAGSLELVSDDYQANRQNAILALAGVRNVIISNVEERSIPGSSDKYALVIDFVGQQDKVSNKLQRRFHSTVESKRKLVKGLLRMIDRVSGTIIVNPNIASSRITGLDPNARPYRLGKNTPPWIAELAIATKAACEKTDNASPPLAWQTASGNTWTQRYAYWGAEKIILGKSKNIILDGTFAKDVATNVVIERELANWEAEMELIVRKAKEHLGDEESFKKYFGEEVYQDIVTTVMLGTSGCYDDLKLPSYPGTTVAMPPEFYVYDDSDENPSISSLSDAGSTRALIKKVIEREVESHNVMALQTFASNLYVSKNFWNIKKNRLGELESYKTVEFEQFKENNLFSDGALAWEPVYHRNGYDDPLWNNENTNEWKNLVSKAYGDNTTFGFLDRVIQLAPAIQFEDETPTAGAGAAASATVQEGLRSGRSIRSAFGDEWNTVSFGPNLKNIYVDAIQEGRIVDDSAKAIVMASDNPEALKQQAELTGKETVVGTMTITPDGTITVGETFAEREAAKTPGLFGDRGLLGTAKDLYQQETGIELGKDWRQTAIIAPGLMLSATATAIAGTAWVIGEYIQSTTGIKTFANIGLALTAISAIPAIAHTKLAQTLNEKPQNPAEAVGALNSLNDTYKKLMPLSYSKNRIDIMADETLAYSLAGKSKDINFRRAFPTFKIYFIESDTDDSYEKNGKIIRAFDDFYDYSAIEEIRVIKSKDIPADLAVIRMANLGSNLFAKRFGDDYLKTNGPEKELNERHGLYSETDKEDPFDKFVFQDGVRIQIRLGYDDSPDRLTTVFLGQIVEIGTSADGKLLEIVCQGFGAELESVELGGEDKTVFFSSQSALSSAILQPTIVNFGRRDRNAAYSPGTTRNQFTGGAGADYFESTIIRDWFEGKRDQYFNRYTFLNDPQDDNIFAPSPTTYTGAWERFWNNACVYRPLKITPWEVFKEHELRHPGYISLPVPYGHTNRMTMFFGSKSQHYWCKPPSSLEVLMAEGAQDQAIRARGLLVKNPKNASVVSDKINELAKTMPTIAEAMLRDILSNSSAVGASFEIAKMFGRYVPFRNYHYFDSTYHILANNIKCSSENIANEVEISYFDSENSLRGGFFSSGDDPSEIIADMANGEADTYSVKLDDNIPEDKIKTYHDEYPSCITKYMAKRYAQGLFERILKEAYSGELTVIGDETIKPYDILNINDKTINMTGPAEVKEVIHLFNRSEGFVSIVSPGMCVSVNDGFDVPILNSMLAMQSLVWNYADNQNSDTSFTTATKLGCTVGLPFMGFIFYQMATQEGTPVFVHPMTLNGVAFSPSMIKKSGNLISSTLGRWKQWWTDLGAAFKELDVSESLVDARIDLIGSILNWMSRTTEKR